MEETRNRAIEIVVWCACLTGMFIIGVGAWTVRQFFPYLGTLVLICVAVLLPLIPVLGYAFVIRYITHHTHNPITEFGNSVQDMWGRHKVIAPQAVGGVKVTEEKPAKFKLIVPAVTELLEKGMLGTADLLLGYRVDNGEPYWGVWGVINTFCVAGKSRSGKTITLFFLILQALLNHAIVWVIDPHGVSRQKKSALRMLLEPLGEWVRFASTDDEIAVMVEDFWECMEARRLGHDRDLTPRLLAVDEFTGAAEDYPKLYEVVNKAAREWAGYNGFCAIAGHEWTQGGKLLVKMRRNLHAKFVHRIDGDYAKYLLNSKKIAPLAEKLRTGNNYFQDNEGEIVELRTPLGVREDAITVAEKLLQIAGPEYVPQLETSNYQVQQITPPPMKEQASRLGTRQLQPETDDFVSHTSQVLSLPPAPETKDFNSYQGRKEEVRRLRGLNFRQGQIIFKIWEVHPGESQAYEDALAEYKQILSEL